MPREHEAVFVMWIGIGLEDAGFALPESDGELPIFGSVPDQVRIRAIEGASAWDDHVTRVFRTLRRRCIVINSYNLFPVGIRASSGAEDADQCKRADQASCDVTIDECGNIVHTVFSLLSFMPLRFRTCAVRQQTILLG